MNITLKELKYREKELLNSHVSNFIEYGKALKEIIKIAESDSSPKLSEEVFLNDCARKYVEKEKRLFDLTQNNKHKLHIKAASELFRKEFASFDDIYKYIYNPVKIYTFEEAKKILKKLDLYNKIKPQTLVEALEFAKLNKE
jgi:plasmid replication initiation protein